MIPFEDYFDTSLSNTTYHTNMEHFQDILSLTKLYMAVYTELAEAPTSDQEQYSKLIASAWIHIASREDSSSQTVDLPLLVIKNCFSLTFYEYLCLILSLCIELDEGLCHTFSSLCGSPYPSFHLAMCLYGITEEIDETLFSSADLTASPLQYLLSTNDLTDHPSLMRQPMCLRKSVLLYLTHKASIDDDFCYFFSGSDELYLAPIYSELQSKLSNFLVATFEAPISKPHAIVLEGAKGLGKKTIIKSLCTKYHVNCIFLDLSKLQMLSPSQLTDYTRELCFKLLISNSLLTIYSCDFAEGLKHYHILLDHLSSIAKVIFLSFDATFSNSHYNEHFDFLPAKVSSPSLSEKIAIWDYMKAKYKLPINATEYANKYDLSFATLNHILDSSILTAQCDGLDNITHEILTQAILSNSCADKNTYIVNHPYTFDDLVLEENTLNSLHRICDHIKYRYTLYEEWGFKNKFPYGRGLSILFYGSPGTGKTMCASILANEWGLTLLKVDLSQVIDKYIGETEKRLDEIFATAKKNNCVLFFDEADALFSKRTEVSSSNDKYANIEVSHLLQKIEIYDGIVILATNLAQNFDDAFKRRINFMLRFNLPNADIRKELWQKALPPEAPLSEDIDFDLLGEKYELSPSVIKSTALYAGFLAVAEHRAISMKHILESIKSEYEKSNRLLPQ